MDFLSSISLLVVSFSIETLVLVFQFGRDQPERLPYVAAVGVAASLLLVAWGAFVWFNRSAEEIEPEAMEEAKQEDQEVQKGGR